jgi:branched-chain amino acid transport system substrate-binding protein
MKNGKRKLRLNAVILIAVFGLVAAACGSSDDTTTTAAAAATTTTAAAATTTTAAAETTTTEMVPVVCEATIGLMAPITGPVAFIGEVQLNWAKYAVEVWNDGMGWDVQLIEGDTMFDVAQSATLAAQFVDNTDILAVVGPAGSDQVDAAGAVFEAGDPNLTFISPSSTRIGIAEKYAGMFRTVPTDADQGPSTADFMVEAGASKVFMIDDQSSYSSGLADETADALEAAGVEVVRESVSQDITDFSALVATIPDDTSWVYLPWQVAANGQIFGNQMAEQGKDIPIFGSDGMNSDDFTIAGSIVAAFAGDIAGIPDSVPLLEGFLEQYPETNTFGPPTFAAVTTELQAIDVLCQSGNDLTRENVLGAIQAINRPTSILGQAISFAPSGDLIGGRFFFFEIQEDGTKTAVG